MSNYLDLVPSFVEVIESMKETIITNIILIGQIPSPTFREKERARFFLDRLAEYHVDECTEDGYHNPIGIIRGKDRTKPPIFIIAHLDTFIQDNVDHNFTVKKKTIFGPGILDNSLSIGVMASLPVILQKLDLKFDSDIVLAGVVQSIGRGNLRGIRHLLKTWPTPIRGAVCLEGVEMGRLNYYSYGMIRCEVECIISEAGGWSSRFRPNAILILHDVINQILKLRLPQKPRSRVIIGKIGGGFKHGKIAFDAKLGFEIQSDSDKMVKEIFNDISDIVAEIGNENEVGLELKTISNVNASRLNYNHPLVKNAAAIMKVLGIKPLSDHSESELSLLLSRNIPAVTVGITHGDNYHLNNAKMEIEPMFKGIAQVLGILMAIDSGVCDGE